MFVNVVRLVDDQRVRAERGLGRREISCGVPRRRDDELRRVDVEVRALARREADEAADGQIEERRHPLGEAHAGGAGWLRHPCDFSLLVVLKLLLLKLLIFIIFIFIIFIIIFIIIIILILIEQGRHQKWNDATFSDSCFSCDSDELAFSRRVVREGREVIND